MNKVQNRTDGDYEGDKAIPVFLSARELEVLYYAMNSCSPPQQYQEEMFKLARKIEANIATFLS